MSVPTSSAWTISRVLLLRRHIKELNSRLTLGQLPFSRLCTLGAIEFEIHSTAWVNVDAALYNVDTALVGALYCNRALSSPTGQTKHVRRFNSLESAFKNHSRSAAGYPCDFQIACSNEEVVAETNPRHSHIG
ncbi:hypothetical protein R3P38DRAFT_2800112 [Favolaschia claudopus]|uniref:Uncharacterized protein n=1 Tax=Favolaschia claudopus TaxID=2862362 RepID=A0AAV9ZXX3_9AGAR